MNYNRAAMKEEVKQAIRHTRPHPMLVTLLFTVVVGAGASLISWVMNNLFSAGGTPMNNLLIGIMNYGPDYLEEMLYYAPELFFQLVLQMMTVSLVSSILTSAWNGLMDVGYNGYCLDMVRGMNPSMERIFGGFSRAGSVILAYILVAVFTFLWSMLFAAGMIVLFVIAGVLMSISGAMAGLGFLLMVAAYFGFLIGLLWVVLRYSMVPYAIIDSQNPMSAMDAIRTSKAIMQGRTGSFFVLQLSFIGWYLLEYLVVVVGVIIVIFAAAGSIGSLDSMLYYGDFDFIPILTRLVGPVLIVILLCGAAVFIINLWLTPYRTGCNARFYLYATGGNQPVYPGPYGGPSGPYGGQSGPYGGQSGPYGGPSGPYGGPSGPYGGQPGPYGGQSGPYGYTPPSQSSFSGYTQAEQPPRYGTGTYSQWGAPQAPQAPAPSTAEPPAAPAAPAAPGPFAPAKPAEPAGDAQYEEPYAEPEEPGDNASERPNGPTYP